ncbi:MAG: hypothetical protein ACREFD_16355, partial [Stellaceae bacterium]
DQGRFVPAADVEGLPDDPGAHEKILHEAMTAPFLRGPIDWRWLIAAKAVSHNALVVGLCLWRLVGLTKSPTVMLSNVDPELFGIGRSAKSRAIIALERAGLVKAERRRGRFPRITVIVPRAPNNA